MSGRYGRYRIALGGLIAALATASAAQVVIQKSEGGKSANGAQQHQAKAQSAPGPAAAPAAPAAPAAMPIKTAQAPHKSAEPANLTGPEKTKESHDGGGFWNAKATDWAVVFLTLGLLVVGGAQAEIYRRQAVIMRRSLVETRRSNHLARQAAKLAQGAKEIAEQQAAISGQQTEILAKQHAVGRLAYLSEHRPRLIVRDVVLNQETVAKGEILYSLANTGGGTAKIVESRVFVEHVSSDSPLRPPRSADHDDLGKLELEAGESRDIGLPLSGYGMAPFRPQETVGFTRMLSDMTPPMRTYFVGSILYRDDADHRRRCVFRRVFDFPTRSFRRVDDPDQEYSD